MACLPAESSSGPQWKLQGFCTLLLLWPKQTVSGLARDENCLSPILPRKNIDTSFEEILTLIRIHLPAQALVMGRFANRPYYNFFPLETGQFYLKVSSTPA